jgi:biopolymer transport protein ExbD
LSLEDQVDPAAGRKLSRRKLMIRADQAAPYGYVQGLIQAAGEAGIYMIEVGAAAPPKP